ncbi:cytochrome ubiquinol oxidase subunit I [Pyrodictium abyssi]|uniref:Cytochrome ubiquinol oxidase subunit I n=1 Tax=Pyrodictium abyssi TaxID=54256 RepID=A0ABN6ZTU6_9CREN|nr:cytochrome ubiquinol oxidase subunit I [Pyrodictium abyssi]
MAGLAPLFLAFVFGLHIVMVNLGIGLAWLVPYFKRRADQGEREFEDVAKTLMRFYAATYGVAGVFGTAFTVFLLSYYPKFLGVAGNITLIPFGLSILAIALHFFAITAYWYGWDRWSRPVHNLIGLLLGVSALLIPLGFRAVFAFLNIPAGLGFDSAEGKLYLDVVAALTKNPTFWPLYLKSIAAAFTATFMAVAGAYAYKAFFRAESEEEKRTALRVASMLAKPALVLLLVTAALGFWYAISLQNVPYKFNNVFAGLGWSVGSGEAYYSVSWLFLLKMLLFLVQLAAMVYALPALAKGSLDAGKAKLLLYGGLAALATIAVGEYVNAFSQYPFFIAVWPDVLAGNVPVEALPSFGISIPAEALPAVVSAVNSVVLLEGSGKAAAILSEMGIAKYFNLNEVVNRIAVDAGVVALTLVFVAALMIGVVYLLYILLFPPRKQVAAARA